jgi:hypothetical protein
LWRRRAAPDPPRIGFIGLGTMGALVAGAAMLDGPLAALAASLDGVA